MAEGPFLAVFDVDGTLIDSQRHICAAMEAAFASERLEPPASEATLSIVGLSLPEAMTSLVPGSDQGLRNRLVSAYKVAYAALRAEDMTALFDGILPMLESLADRTEVILGIATGKSRRGLTHVLKAHGLDRLFVTRQVADDHPSKPHPSMLKAAMSETGVPPDRTVMIGDTCFDVEMGNAAGVGVIGVAWGYHPPGSLAVAGADFVVRSPVEIEILLRGQWGLA
jgi:phosphoglycolate phosphatase